MYISGHFFCYRYCRNYLFCFSIQKAVACTQTLPGHSSGTNWLHISFTRTANSNNTRTVWISYQCVTRDQTHWDDRKSKQTDNEESPARYIQIQTQHGMSLMMNTQFYLPMKLWFTGVDYWRIQIDFFSPLKNKQCCKTEVGVYIYRY
jgi:hypothetical protein